MPSLIISGAEIFDGSGAATTTGQAVVIRGGRIADIVPRAQAGAEGDGDRLDLPGTTLLPGLVDLHVHLAHGTGGAVVGVAANSTPAQIAVQASGNAQAAQRSGITTLRDVAGPRRVPQAVRDAVAAGQLNGPRVVAAGQAICATGSAFARPPLTGYGREADGPDAVRRAVRGQVKAGADLIKVILDGSRGIIEFTQPEVDAIVDEAHRCNRRVACHATRPETIGMALDAGADTIEHGGVQNDREVLARMADQGTVLVPTLLAVRQLTQHTSDIHWQMFQHLPRERVHAVVARRSASFFRSALARGVVIGAGTDTSPQLGGFAAVPDELAVMTELGLSPALALATATSAAARALGRDHELGKITRGAVADLIVCAGKPATDIAALRDILLVVQDGRVVHADPAIAVQLSGREPGRDAWPAAGP
jgi:imidazolonepropionase-like amidohydrolase